MEYSVSAYPQNQYSSAWVNGSLNYYQGPLTTNKNFNFPILVQSQDTRFNSSYILTMVIGPLNCTMKCGRVCPASPRSICPSQATSCDYDCTTGFVISVYVYYFDTLIF